MKIKNIINIIQFIKWFVVCATIFYLIIIISGTGNWLLALEIGILIQLILFLINWRLGVNSNLKRAFYNIILVIAIGFMELENYGIMRTRVFEGESGYSLTYLFIFFVTLWFLFSVIQIITEMKTINKQKSNIHLPK